MKCLSRSLYPKKVVKRTEQENSQSLPNIAQRKRSRPILLGSVKHSSDGLAQIQRYLHKCTLHKCIPSLNALFGLVLTQDLMDKCTPPCSACATDWAVP